MKTLDGYELEDGDDCFVCVQDPEGVKQLTDLPLRAIYRSEKAREMGWDFEIPHLVFEGQVEVCGVWKEKP